MTKIEERTTANVDVVLEKVCRSLPHGGDHEGRKYVANKLMQSMKKETSRWKGCGLWPAARFLNCRGANRPNAILKNYSSLRLCSE